MPHLFGLAHVTTRRVGQCQGITRHAAISQKPGKLMLRLHACTRPGSIMHDTATEPLHVYAAIQMIRRGHWARQRVTTDHCRGMDRWTQRKALFAFHHALSGMSRNLCTALSAFNFLAVVVSSHLCGSGILGE
jgi:hypothetical protein